VLWWISNQKTTQMPAETQEVLTRCVVDTLAKKFYLYSSEGGEKTVNCETIDQFMNVLEVVRSRVDDNCLVYTSPL
jgi:hypothetical protein